MEGFDIKYIDYKERREQGTFTFPIAYYHQTPISPRYYMTYHWHTQYEIMRIISGTFNLTIDNETRLYKEGDVIFVTDGELHGGIPHECVYDCVVFDLNMLLKDNHACANTIYDIFNHKIHINSCLTDNSTRILPITRELCHALATRKNGYEFMTQGYLYELLGVIVEEKLYEEVSDKSLSSQRLSSIKDVLSYISENYGSNISLDSLAAIAGMNPKYFCRYFKSMTERTPIDYLNYYRIECACEMLSTKNISIKEAAITCGFSDESYFIKAFRRYKGITPKQFIMTKF